MAAKQIGADSHGSGQTDRSPGMSLRGPRRAFRPRWGPAAYCSCPGAHRKLSHDPMTLFCLLSLGPDAGAPAGAPSRQLEHLGIAAKHVGNQLAVVILERHIDRDYDERRHHRAGTVSVGSASYKGRQGANAIGHAAQGRIVDAIVELQVQNIVAYCERWNSVEHNLFSPVPMFGQPPRVTT